MRRSRACGTTLTTSRPTPKRPQDLIPLASAAHAIGCLLADGAPAPVQLTALDQASAGSFPASDPISITQGSTGDRPSETYECDESQQWPSSPVPVTLADGRSTTIDNGHVVMAAITSCTNTSNPSVMIGAGQLAKKAVEQG